MPSFVEYKQIEGLGAIKDDSRKSLMDVVLEQLGTSVAQSELEKKLWHRPEFGKLRHYIETLSETAATFDERRKFERLIKTDQRDNLEALTASLVEVVRQSEHTDLFELGRRFGTAIAEAEYAIDVLARPDHYRGGDDDNEFTIATYVSSENVDQLSKQVQNEFPGLTFTLLQSIGTDLDLEYQYAEYEWDEMAERAIPHVTSILGSLWTSLGEILGLVRERDLFARIADAGSSTPRAHRLTRRSSLSQAEEALSQAEETLADVDRGKRSPELVILNLVPVLEIILDQVWPRIGESGQSLANGLNEKLQSGNVMEKRFAGTAKNLHLSYRNPASHGRGTFACIQAEARYFVAGLRSLLEMSKHLIDRGHNRSNDPPQPDKP